MGAVPIVPVLRGEDAVKPIDLSTMSADEIIAEADRRWAERLGKAKRDADAPPQSRPAPIRPSGPFSASIPFHLLVSDNERALPVIQRKGKAVFPRLVLNRRYKAAKAEIRKLVKAQIPDGFVPFAGPVRVTVTIREPDRDRRRDITNWCKQLGDALTGIVYDDDSQVDEAVYLRGSITEGGAVLITVTPLLGGTV